ncbi:thiosulfate oxidation carrier complex protein SoxZ [Notoacmeibacter sp. MSK16QG-6]|uniref:thiosulfate oxidation carrier complex protein SoxZ n=1 Tax=Notoacmeibacter sp. MSK16QG-6 TaxID=2957982 RepID=UPI0020A0E62C|nr:thiosulfate oxidation carrier complex protein SoxZ [Notoacmeibacter sp. MSK16QG-6]MCP1200814.1 thiosulfate oxidation carrier complex protein SoxZ [Notoacmeibacter sp. MSK16QG-6]
MASKPRVKLPKSASAGEVITVKTLISHEMESGQRKDKNGEVIPRQIINKFTVTFNEKPVFEADIEPAISSNPYFEFSVKVPESGTFHFKWEDDDGSVYETEEAIEVA